MVMNGFELFSQKRQDRQKANVSSARIHAEKGAGAQEKGLRGHDRILLAHLQMGQNGHNITIG